MPLYDWKCCKCEAVIEVSNPMSMSGSAPTKCNKCGNTIAFKKVINAPRLSLNEAHKSPYPVTIPKLEKIYSGKRDGLNRPIVEYKDKTFNTKVEQDAYMKANNLVLLADYKDPSIGPSQNGHFSKKRADPPPSTNAEKMAEGCKFIDGTELKENYNV